VLKQFQNRNFFFVVGMDAMTFVVSLWAAHMMRFDFALTPTNWTDFVFVLPLAIVVKAVVFLLMGAYKGLWRYTSLIDVLQLVQASVISTLIIMGGLTFVSRFEGYSRSVFLIDCILTCFLCSATRAGIRMFYNVRWSFGLDGEAAAAPKTIRRLMVIGAGDAADKILREISDNNDSPYAVVCCLDDKPSKQGRSLHGAPIVGPIQRLPEFVARFNAKEALIAIPSMAGDRVRQIVELAKKSGIPCRTLPSISSLIDGRVSVNDVKEVDFEDLLGRPAVALDSDSIGHYLTDKVVLVTGGGGSIGSELCRQIVRYRPKTLVMVDAHEFNLYAIELELRQERKIEGVMPVLGRVQDVPLMTRVFETWKPDVVFHAAAYKHVPMLETNPWEAVFNNILGSRVVMDMAERFGVERCVLVSTDKAVRPTNVMGATKRMAEMLLQSRPPGKTRFMAVRFGNVIGSSGSVIPLFKRQIKNGGPVTVTHPDMTRYFMTIPEASQLILQAGAMGTGGEIFILEMGAPVKIDAMARDLIRLSGKEPERDIQIVYTGLRPGEKLYEELITHGEGIVETGHSKIMVLRRHGPGAAEPGELESGVKELMAAAVVYDAPRIKGQLKRMIPEYQPAGQ
jgi:FlaA1/EpsC-like NDP-sugar epimerase